MMHAAIVALMKVLKRAVWVIGILHAPKLLGSR
jgi:hypothetical protein